MGAKGEGLSDYLPDEETLYKEEVRRNLERVFGYLFSKEADDKRLKRLPIFFDALQRGLPIFERRLESTPFVLENPIARKKYFLDKGQLRWQVVPKTDDPFDQIPFYREYKAQGLPTEGETEILTDPVLTNQALLEGLRQQKLLYDGFSNTVAKVVRTRTIAAATLRYIHSQEVSFVEIQDADLRLKKLKKPEEELREAFIENFVLGNDPVLERYPDIDILCDHILALDALFLNEGASKSARSLSENALAIELVANPRSFSNLDKFKATTTTIDNIFNVNRFINAIRSESTHEEFLVRISMLVYKVLEEADGYLKQFFEQNHIPDWLGREFFTNLLYQKLKDLPARDWEEFSDDSPGRLWKQQRISNYYSLPDENLVVLAQGGQRTRTEVADKTTLSVIEEGQFVHDFLKLGKFPIWIFERLDPPVQKALLRRILQHKDLLKEKVCLDKVSELLNKLRLVYSTSDKKFARGRPVSKTDMSEATALLPSQHLLEVLSGEIKTGNKTLSAILEVVIVNALIKELLEQKLQMEIIPRRYRHDRARRGFDFNSLVIQYRDQNKEEESAINDLLDYVCATALMYSEPLSPGSLNERAAFFKAEVASDVRNELGSLNKLPKNHAKKVEPRLRRLLSKLRQTSLTTRSHSLLEEVKQKHYGEYYQRREGFLLKVLEDSLKSA